MRLELSVEEGVALGVLKSKTEGFHSYEKLKQV